MIAQHADHIHCRLANLLLQPGGGLLANAMMVAHDCPGFLDCFEDAVLQSKILIDVSNTGNEDEVQIGSLRIGMGKMRHADGLRT